MMTPVELQRFNSKWTEKDGCHLWNGPLDRDGYGTFFLRRLSRGAHRVGYFSKHGVIGAALIGHTCRNRSCVNPDHLKIVTARENAIDNSFSVTSANAAKTHCPRGHEYDMILKSKRGLQRGCRTCERAKKKRLRAKWRAEDTLAV